jgi:hypothetical protein
MKPSKEASQAAKIIYTKSLCNERLWCELFYAETIQEIVCAPLEQRIAELNTSIRDMMELNKFLKLANNGLAERITDYELKLSKATVRIAELEELTNVETPCEHELKDELYRGCIKCHARGNQQLAEEMGKRIVELGEDNFALSANQCIYGLVNDESGNQDCPLEKMISKLQKENIELRTEIDALEEID